MTRIVAYCHYCSGRQGKVEHDQGWRLLSTMGREWRTVESRSNSIALVAQDLDQKLANATIIIEDENRACALHNGPGYREPLGC
jgi:hypothetical protein